MSTDNIAAKKQRVLELLDGWLGRPVDDPAKQPVRDAVNSLPDDDGNEKLVARLDYVIAFLELSALRRKAVEHLMLTMSDEEVDEFIQMAQQKAREYLKKRFPSDSTTESVSGE